MGVQGRQEPRVNNQSSDRIRQQHRTDKLAFVEANQPTSPSAWLCPSAQDDEMAPGQKMYPRATVKKIVKAHSNCNVSKNADVTVSRALKAPTRFLRVGTR